MGYTTDFHGRFDINEPLDANQIAYLNRFADSRRMMRDVDKTEQLEDSFRLAVGLPVGKYGQYYVGSREHDEDDSIINYNYPPEDQPSLWCQWVPSEDGKYIVWDDNEKFYCYVEWIKYIIKHFLIPWNKKLNGEVCWYGEDNMDIGIIVIKDNVVTTKIGKITYEDQNKNI